jgi:hypothetical protein
MLPGVWAQDAYGKIPMTFEGAITGGCAAVTVNPYLDYPRRKG